MTVTPDEDDRLLAVLAQLRDVGRRVNQLNLGDPAVLDATLRLIAESAVTIIPGATAILYTYDPARGSLDPVSRTSAGDHPALLRDATPRPDGLGMRAIRRTQPVLSYDEPDLDIHPDRRSAGAAAAACLPLLVAGQPLGALYVYLAEARRLSQLELLLLDNFVAQAAMALYLAGQVTHTRRNLARKEDELALLRHAGLLISSRTRLEDTLVAILEMALEVTGARYGIFRLVDRSGQNLVMRAIAGERLGRPAVEALPINTTSIMGLVAKTRQPVNIADVREPPWSRIYYPLDHSLQMRAELAVPLIGAGGRLEGVLNLESPHAGAFSEADSHLLQGLATQAVIAIQEVRLLDALRDTSTRVLTQDLVQVQAHLAALRSDLVSGDTEWDRKVEAILAEYEALARANAARQEALREAQEARAVAETFAAMGDVAANLLHHLNNKVGTIPVRIEGIQDKCAPALAENPYLAANLAEIERAALDAMATVRDRLALLHPIEAGPVSVADCVADALAAARLPPGVAVQSAGLAQLPPVLAGRETLALVIVNLLDNAAEAMNGRGVVQIGGTAAEDWVELAITDDGPGIPPDNQARIFEFRFSERRRADGRLGAEGARSARSRLGFGLWWVKTMMTRLGGAVSVESDGHRGTTFRLRLPQAARQADGEAAS